MPMGKAKRTIKAKALVSDLRSNMTDDELMAKYCVTDTQLRKALGRLVDLGLIGEMELYERSTLSDTTVTRAFVETQKALHDLTNAPPAEIVEEVDPAQVVEVTEVVDVSETGLKKMLETLRS